ncbi:bifunctional adenosylcobinamide kinase/adenosylcobinamide-phosphate guanylyltransferase [Cognatiyoonia sp. IB215182]|uniref:bifunctional adenosylcobinamide kinase/adenosylcobinamide-phosphate guanylyltransferase n=1 Tax=Cognatiyoonia sp. IB215182 TaxID=3097353 RepID=UPI002A16A571|nr:bifunctional adenosylcobinamide kinase/adenosylcobinamide-phosphate guanylyltransferase [Cognatiyoonia sp. IB215182]MDX8351718.1 bifunctional adenosylcobinamide kinase/adenosylcobinamide-phosphate guanylyltransferase [Cognatiyoonia sp. IB215182]
MLPKISLVLGGAASGKSAYAENLVLSMGLAPIYIATAQSFDDEMTAKIAAHQEARDAKWHTIEEPIDLPAVLAQRSSDQAVLIDCATLWLSNLLLGAHDLDARCADLVTALQNCDAPVAVVSNEVGQGVVPDNALARRFRNAQGRLNQQIASIADRVVVVMAGLPMTLKDQSQ